MAHCVDSPDGSEADKGVVLRRDSKTGAVTSYQSSAAPTVAAPAPASAEDIEATRRLHRARELRKTASAMDTVTACGFVAKAVELERSAATVSDGSLPQLSPAERAQAAHFRRMANEVSDSVVRQGYLAKAAEIEGKGW